MSGQPDIELMDAIARLVEAVAKLPPACINAHLAVGELVARYCRPAVVQVGHD